MMQYLRVIRAVLEMFQAMLNKEAYDYQVKAVNTINEWTDFKC